MASSSPSASSASSSSSSSSSSSLSFLPQWLRKKSFQHAKSSKQPKEEPATCELAPPSPVKAQKLRILSDEQYELLFKENAHKCVQQMGENGKSVSEIVTFLHRPQLDPKEVGNVLGQPDNHSLEILQAYAHSFIFKNFSFDVSLRVYLGRFNLPGEAQKIDRILQAFAKAYFHANKSPSDLTEASDVQTNCHSCGNLQEALASSSTAAASTHHHHHAAATTESSASNGVALRASSNHFDSEDSVYTLAFSIVLLNTDAHNPHLSKHLKMRKEDFIRNHQRLSDSKMIDPRLLAELFDSFATFPIQMIPHRPLDMSMHEIEVVFDGPDNASLGLDIETSLDGHTCIVRNLQPQSSIQVGWSCGVDDRPELNGWVIVAVGNDCTRQIGYQMTRYLLKTAQRPIAIRFCEPSSFFASL